MEKTKSSKAINFVKNHAIYGVLVIVALFFTVMSSKFFTIDNWLTIVRQVSMMGICAIGMTFVLLTGGIDLSIGSGITFVNIFCAYLMVEAGLPPFLAILINLAIMFLVGAFQGFLVTKIGIPPIIATMAFMNIFKGIAYVISGGLPINGFEDSFKMIGQGYIFGVFPIPILIMIIIFVIGAFILYKFYLGRYFYAIGGNKEAAKLSGIKVDRVTILVYALNGLFAAIAGIIYLSRLNSGSPATGSGFEFDVITACVLGGVSVNGGYGKISGVLAGVIIMGMLDNGLIMIGLSEYWKWIVKGAILCLAVGIDCMSKKKKKA